MNEPNSVMGDILQLCVLAGSKRDRGHNGEWVNKPNVTPDEITPASWVDTATWPQAGTVTMFNNHSVPVTQILIVTYISCVTGLADESTLEVNFGMPPGTAAGFILQSVLNGTASTLYYSIPPQGLFNCPIFTIFPGGSKPKLILGSDAVLTVDSVSVSVRLNGYLLDSSKNNLFKRYQSMVFFD